jgi:ribonuclease HI
VTSWGELEPIAAEALAVIYGIRLCTEQGLDNIVIESDAKQITDAIQSRTKQGMRVVINDL